MLDRYRTIFANHDTKTQHYEPRYDEHPAFNMSPTLVQVGYSWLARRSDVDASVESTLHACNFCNSLFSASKLEFLHSVMHPLEHVMKCVERRYCRDRYVGHLCVLQVACGTGRWASFWQDLSCAPSCSNDRLDHGFSINFVSLLG